VEHLSGWLRLLACALLFGQAACADGGDAVEAQPEAPEEASAPPAVGLTANETCREADPRAAVAQVVAASVVRASAALGETGARWDTALTQLAAAQTACFAADLRGPVPDAAARSLRAALLRDVTVPREDRGGMPALSWRLLEDGSQRAAREMPSVDAALRDGNLAVAHLGLVAAQRARLRDIPEVLRFLDEAHRAALLEDPAWMGWLGVAQ